MSAPLQVAVPDGVTASWRLPRGVRAYLDLASGCLRVSGTRAQFADDEFATALSRTLIHELFHFAQAIAYPWLHELVVQYSARVAVVFSRIPPEGLAVTIAGRASLPDVRDLELGRLAAAMHEAHDGLTAVDLLESAAYLYEHRAAESALGPTHYQRMLPHAPAPAYRKAYEVAAAQLGELAWHDLLPMTHAAMCAEVPAACFHVLLHRIARERLDFRNAPHPLYFYELAADAGVAMLDPRPGMMPYPPASHVFTRGLLHAVTYCNAQRLALPALVCDPAMFEHVLEVGKVSPLLLDDGSIVHRFEYAADLVEALTEDAPTRAFLRPLTDEHLPGFAAAVATIGALGHLLTRSGDLARMVHYRVDG